MRKVSFALILVIAFSAAAPAADLPELQTKVRTLAAFKNGLGFVFRSGTTPLTNGWADMNEPPPAALGTLWIGTTNPLQPVEEVVSYRRTDENSRDALAVTELVDLNVGKTIGITYSTGSMAEPKQVVGKVLSSAGQVVIIETPGARVAIRKDTIQTVEMTSDAVVKGSTVTNRAKVRVGGKPESAEITMAYLEKGVTWSPSYLINIRNNKEADITLEAVLANDAEDLEDTEVSFVVGYPNFMFADITTPLSLQQSVAQFVQALAGDRSDGGFRGTAQVMSQSVMFNTAAFDYSSAERWQPDLSYSSTQPMAGESNEDLYFYRQPHVTLRKGDRARYTVFAGKVPYEHLYELAVRDNRNVDYYGYRSNERDVRDEDPQVWHVLRLENKTQFPWTTAPAMVVNGAMPVAQDVLKYTPPKGSNTLKLTVATDIRAQEERTESSREQTSILGNGFDVVVVKGKLVVKSYKPEPVKMSVKKAVVGEVLESSSGGEVLKTAKRLTAVNPDSMITWEFELAPGVERELTYQYRVLIRR